MSNDILERAVNNGVEGKVVYLSINQDGGMTVVLEHENGSRSTFDNLRVISVGLAQNIPNGGLLGYV